MDDIAQPLLAPYIGDEGDGPTEPSSEPEGSPSPHLKLTEVLVDLQETVRTGLADLHAVLRDKLTYDRFKEEQISRLHEELQSFKSDLISKPARQLLQGLIRLHDDLGKMATALRQRPAEELTPERFFQQFADFQDDIELLLGQNGVEPFETSGDSFEPRRQTVLRTITTEDPDRVGQVAEHLRPGFEQGEALLQKERVAVYIASNSNDNAQGGQP